MLRATDGIPLTKADFCPLLPHGENLCLLDLVREWNPEMLRASTQSHRDPTNPLCRDGRLPAVAIVEYAAQATAIHAALVGNGPPATRFIGALKNISLPIQPLSEFGESLTIEVRVHLAGDQGAIYKFTAMDLHNRIGSGRMTLVQSPQHKEIR